jgi:hypothetical protein
MTFFKKKKKLQSILLKIFLKVFRLIDQEKAIILV